MSSMYISERDARTFSKQDDGRGGTVYRATRVFDVGPMTNGETAADALDMLEAAGYVQGAPHPQSDLATLTGIDQTENVVAGMATYTVTYASDSGGDTGAAILEPPVISIKPYRYPIDSDVDAYGCRYENTATFPFDGGMPLEKRGKLWTYERWFTSYPWQQDDELGGCVNSNDMTLPGIPGTMPPGTVKFLGVEQGERSSISPVVRCRYTFDYRSTGHTHDVINQGELGWCTPTGSSTRVVGTFRAGNDTSVSPGPIRLGPLGLPMNTAFKVGTRMQPAANAERPPDDEPKPSQGNYNPANPGTAGRVNMALSSGLITILSFPTVKSVNMTIIL